MYSIVSTAIVHGIESIPITVEADISEGLPVFEMVGFLSAEVKEAKERVRTALKNSGFILPAKRITVNFSPANIRKTGSGFDLPVALAILCALGMIPEDSLKDSIVIGELGLNGKIQGVTGVLPIVAMAKKNGKKACLIPECNRKEAGLVSGMAVYGMSDLKEAISFLNGGAYVKKQILI